VAREAQNGAAVPTVVTLGVVSDVVHHTDGCSVGNYLAIAQAEHVASATRVEAVHPLQLQIRWGWLDRRR